MLGSIDRNFGVKAANTGISQSSLKKQQLVSYFPIMFHLLHSAVKNIICYRKMASLILYI